MTFHEGTAHSLAARGPAVKDLAGQALAGGGHGGHHLRIIAIVVAVIVVAVIAWIIIAGRARRKRGQR